MRQGGGGPRRQRALAHRRRGRPARSRRRPVHGDLAPRALSAESPAVADVAASAKAAEVHGGSVLSHTGDEAVLRDPDGAQFTVTSRRVR
ncbi:hypothetical protein OG459_45460 [Streptomyces canus]